MSRSRGGAAALEEQPTAPPATAPVTLRLEQIMISKTNPRQHFDAAAMAELVSSVRRLGVLQPVLVRPSDGLLVGVPGSIAGDGRYELVAGERRYRAAREAGLAEIPALVRQLTDVEVLEIQITENLLRSDLHPLEEAEGYDKLVRLHGRTVAEIAEKIGKSPGYVYGRLKLTDLGPEARKYLLEGTLDATVAVLLARIADPATQTQALHAVLDLGSPETYRHPLSFRDAKTKIESFQKRLRTATFDRDDAELDPIAGPCAVCPKNTGVAPSLFAGEKKGEDMCLDPKCFEGKTAKAWEQKTAKVKEQGKKVLPPSKAKGIFDRYSSGTELPHNSPYVKLNGTVPVSSAGKKKPPTWKQALGKDAPEVVVVMAPNGSMVELIPKKAAMEVAVARGLAWAKAETQRTEKHDWQAENRKREEKIKIRQAAIAEVLPKLGQAAAKRGPDAGLLRLLVLSELGGYHVGSDGQMVALQRYGKVTKKSDAPALVGKLNGSQLTGLLVELIVADDRPHEDKFPPAAIDFSKLYRIDISAPYKRLQAEAKAAAKAQPVKGRAGKGKRAALHAEAEAEAEAALRVCRECGCTDATPCSTEHGPCAWVDAEQSLCSAAACVAKAEGAEDLGDDDDDLGAGEEE